MQHLNRRRNPKLWGAFALVCMTAACGRGGQPGSASSAVSNDVWAVVGNTQITRDEVDKAYRVSVQPTPTPPSEEEILTVKLGIVDELINQEILIARAASSNLTVTDAEVDTAFAERKGALTDEAFQLQVSQAGLTVDDVKRGLRRELIVRKVVDRDITPKVTVTDEDIAAFYNSNRAQFNLTEPQYRLAQIVVTPTRDQQVNNRMRDDAATAADARRKVDMLTERLRGGGDFGEIAMDYSEDPQSAVRGGDLGYVPASALDQVAPQLKDAVLKMKPGSVSTVSINGNYTILVMVSQEAAGQRDLNAQSVKDSIREVLQGRREQLIRTAYINAARADTKIVNNLAHMVIDGKLPAKTVAAAVPAATTPAKP